MAMLCGSISGVAICLKSVDEDEAEGAVVVPDEGGWVDTDELVVGGRGGKPCMDVGMGGGWAPFKCFPLLSVGTTAVFISGKIDVRLKLLRDWGTPCCCCC